MANSLGYLKEKGYFWAYYLFSMFSYYGKNSVPAFYFLI